MERPKLLVIEDDADSRELLKELLADEFDIRTAPDGEAGLEQFRRDRPDVVLTDETLPGMRGTAVAREMKALSPNARVVLVSGYGDVEDTEACDLVLKKPVEPEQLAQTLHALADS